jgi:hypothetical protein
MATKAEQFHSDEERRHKKTPKAAPAPEGEARTTHHQSQANVSRETVAAGTRPSRKSTRSSVNRGRNDTALTRRASAKKSSSDSRARDARTRSTRTRGK